MAKLSQDDTIKIYSKKIRIDKLVESFEVIPSSEIVKYLENKEIYIPNTIHRALIRKNIAPIIANADNDDKFSDEMRHRLKWFDNFTIFQLERLAESYRIKINVARYKRDFWEIIVRHRNDLGINNLEFIKLQNLTWRYQKHPQESYTAMIDTLSALFFEPPGYFEGCPVDQAKEVLLNSTTLTDIRDLGKKYDINIPRRINKKQLVEMISLKLDLTEFEQEELNRKSILQIERYAKEQRINVSIELRKADMIEFILLKREHVVEQHHRESLKLFDSIDIESYIHKARFEEMTHTFNVRKKKKRRNIRNLIIVAIIVATVALLIYLEALT